ncbi:hypothetical protein BGX23_010394 [Mortierella sp. AD031]|nr:hypothetical protein BGX23_010394 [Mortierella sp. AD031]
MLQTGAIVGIAFEVGFVIVPCAAGIHDYRRIRRAHADERVRAQRRVQEKRNAAIRKTALEKLREATTVKSESLAVAIPLSYHDTSIATITATPTAPKIVVPVPVYKPPFVKRTTYSYKYDGNNGGGGHGIDGGADRGGCNGGGG